MRAKLRVVFMGTPDFAVPTLRAVSQRHEILAVVTQPDRPKGRGRALAPPPVKTAAEQMGLTVLQPPRVRRRAVREQLQALAADVFVVAAFGQILSKRLLELPKLGCVNVHASLLPRLRGAAPIQWAIMRGEHQSGVTIMQMDEGVDTGPILLKQAVSLREDETAASLHDRLAPLGADLLVEALERLAANEIVPEHQDDGAATAAPLLTKEDAHLDWSLGAEAIARRIRGLDPWPGAFTRVDGQPIKLFRPTLDEACGEPGEVLSTDGRGILVGCGGDSLWVGEVQLPGRRRMSAAAMLAGHPLPLGTRLS